MTLLRKLSIPLIALATLAAGSAVAFAQSGDANPQDIDEQVLFTKGDSGYGCFRIPAITEAANGDLLAFAEARKEFCGDAGHIDLVMKRSTDGGQNWGDAQIVLRGTDEDPEAPATRGNPVPIVDSESGDIALLTTFNPADDDAIRTPYIQRSEDHGETWTDAQSLAEVIDEPEWGWYATGPGGGIQLTRGDNAGRMVAGVNFSDGEGGNGAALVYSDDAGETWQRGATDIKESGDIIPQELSLFERTDGAVYAAARENGKVGEQTRTFAVASDVTDSFDAPFETIDDLVGTPAVQGGIVRLRASDTGDDYDRVVFSSPVHSELRMTMTIRSSFDEGETWQSVDEGTTISEERAAYSDMEALSDGRLALLYEGGDYPDGDANDEIRLALIDEEDLGTP